MLMRVDPLREVDRWAQQLRSGTRAPVMPLDAYRQGDRYVVHFDLPGVDPQSIELTVEKDVLTVRAERSWQLGEGQEALVSERPQGSFARQLFLGDGLDAEHIEAHYDGGVLTVIVPVAETAKPRRVEIHAGSGPKAIDAAA